MGGGRGGAKCHGPLICPQLSCGTLTARVFWVRSGGVKSLSLAVADGLLSWVPLRVSLWRLGHISSGVLCLYESIKDGGSRGTAPLTGPRTSVTVDTLSYFLLAPHGRRLHRHADTGSKLQVKFIIIFFYIYIVAPLSLFECSHLLMTVIINFILTSVSYFMHRLAKIEQPIRARPPVTIKKPKHVWALTNFGCLCRVVKTINCI